MKNSDTKTVLFVDDDTNLLASLRRSLRDQPYQLFIANSSELAMDMFRREAFDLVVVDHKMEGATGTELISWLAEHFPKTVRIMLTGNADIPMMKSAINEGKVFRFLTKPCHLTELALAVRDGLDSQETSLEVVGA